MRLTKACCLSGSPFHKKPLTLWYTVAVRELPTIIEGGMGSGAILVWWRSRRWGNETDRTRQEAACRHRETPSGDPRQTHLCATAGRVEGGGWQEEAGSRRPGGSQRQ